MNSLQPFEFGHLFKTDMPFGLLGEFITLMDNNPKVLGVEKCSAILTSLLSIDRFQLTLSFLSSQEKQSLDSLLKKLTDQGMETRELLTSYRLQ